MTRKLNETIDNLGQELSQIIDDIEESMDAVYEIDEPTYRPVISNYQKKLNEYENIVHSISIEPI